MIKRYIILLGCLLSAFTPLQAVKAESNSKVEQGIYVTTEDIISDIIFPTVDKKVQKEYSKDLIGWQWVRIVGINYNNNHSYDIAAKIEVNSQLNGKERYADDLVKLRIFPSCNSNKLKCRHDFKVELLDYSHLSQ
ncbi:hypothetical protein LIT25_18515 [Bacillus sp. F19]|nr:hypothetical protein LIT25_18515 [Bacillus sp. F19]